MKHERSKLEVVIVAFVVGIIVAGIVVFAIMFISKNKSAPVVMSGTETVSGPVAVATGITKETGKSIFSAGEWWTILGILLGLAIWIYILAGYGIFVSFIKSGEVVLVEMGKSFYKLIPNIPGYGVLDNKIAKLGCGDGAKKPKSFLGIYWIGLYPIWKIHEYSLSWDKPISESESEKADEEKKGGTIEKTYFGNISHRKEVVSTVRHKNSVPIILKGMELTKQLKIDIYFDVIFESVDPVFSVFMLNGNWFPLAVSAFSGIISDVLKSMELRATDDVQDSFEKTDKAIKFNSAVADTEKNKIIVDASGMRVAQAVYRDYVIAGEPEAKKAMEGLKIAELNAQIKAKEGEGDGAKIIKIKEAEAAGLEKILKAALTHPLGGEIVKEQLRADRLKNFIGNTLVEGNPATTVTAMLPIPVDNKDKKKPDQKKEEENA